MKCHKKKCHEFQQRASGNRVGMESFFSPPAGLCICLFCPVRSFQKAFPFWVFPFLQFPSLSLMFSSFSIWHYFPGVSFQMDSCFTSFRFVFNIFWDKFLYLFLGFFFLFPTKITLLHLSFPLFQDAFFDS